jgi:hypothetical protein
MNEWSISGMILAGKTRITIRITYPNASMSTTNLTWTDLGYVFDSLVLCTLSVLVSLFSLSCILPFVFTCNETQTSMPLAGFEPAIPAGERLQTYALG